MQDRVQEIMNFVEKVIAPDRMDLKEADAFLHSLQIALVERRQAIIEDLKYYNTIGHPDG